MLHLNLLITIRGLFRIQDFAKRPIFLNSARRDLSVCTRFFNFGESCILKNRLVFDRFENLYNDLFRDYFRRPILVRIKKTRNEKFFAFFDKNFFFRKNFRNPEIARNGSINIPKKHTKFQNQ